MPDSYGKRNRDRVKARKAAEKDERRVARTERRKEMPPVTEPEPESFGEAPPADPES
jgi:hypothetical protein